MFMGKKKTNKKRSEKEFDRVDFEDDDEPEEYSDEEEDDEEDEEDDDDDMREIRKAVSPKKSKPKKATESASTQSKNPVTISEVLDIIQGNLNRANELLVYIRRNQGI